MNEAPVVYRCTSCGEEVDESGGTRHQCPEGSFFGTPEPPKDATFKPWPLPGPKRRGRKSAAIDAARKGE